MLDYEKTYGVIMPKSRWKDIGGQRFGKLTAIHPTGKKRHGQHVWLCKCDCGIEKELPVGVLHHRKGGTKSCGCAIREHNSSYATHGLSRTTMYARWRSMKRRCGLKTNPSYKYYGGRGIKVCDRWLSFENFLQDVGYPPGKNYHLDRIDNDGDYCPENCQWLTASDNNRKKATDRLKKKA